MSERQPYPSDVTREKFALISPILESARKQTKPRQIDLYEVFCALLYLLRTGCPWRCIPHDFPKWQCIYSYYKVWKEPAQDGGPSPLELALKKSGWRGAKEARPPEED